MSDVPALCPRYVCAPMAGSRRSRGVSIEARRGAIVTVIGGERRGQDDAAQRDHGRAAVAGRRSFDGQDILAHAAGGARRTRPVPRARAARTVRRHERRGQSRLGGFRRTAAERRGSSRKSTCAFPRLKERRAATCGHAVGRRAADAGDGPRADGATTAADAGRTEPGAGAAHRARGFDGIGERLGAGRVDLLVEQNARAALQVADHAYVLELGLVSASGTADEIALTTRAWSRVILGLGGGDYLEQGGKTMKRTFLAAVVALGAFMAAASRWPTIKSASWPAPAARARRSASRR